MYFSVMCKGLLIVCQKAFQFILISGPKFKVGVIGHLNLHLLPSEVCTTCGNYSARYPIEVKLSTQKTSADPFPAQVFLLQVDEINRGTPRL
jgi:hypothetical protein